MSYPNRLAFFEKLALSLPLQPAITQLIASHVRSLMANHLSDVASCDKGTLKRGSRQSSNLQLPVHLSGERFA
jgi:hypothetical protein